ncbi:protoporphyrinogen oxidase [Prolixibacter denitrificans]|uniref:Coproporphyrinogen III oxidase n=1 Tax=Prolixibacter denitrificans TaxID=1541063 RepID=A0A2P8CDW1_9BACT|nr:protoporphyrinogen oxidase [Prolixibacter denitrificans]PSK83173.1 oxygen-dependent protoporphyrinogen oxidase [Prolixibacter denitrificans]GET21944.1 protoporphyrinogen oxidase [Prolixibacter denitrificans]
MSNTQNTDVIIIGAGLTGLTAAHYLKKQGKNVRVIEKNTHTGGVIQTVREDGFTFETGPNTGVLGNPDVAELFEELQKDVTLETADPAAKRRLIWKGKDWHALPSGPISAIGTPLFTWYDKFRILGEPFRKKGTKPNESVADLVRRRLGKSFLDYAVNPFISGVYAGDPEYLVTEFALPKLFNLEQNYGSFVGGAMKKRKEPKEPRDSKATREVFSAQGGLVSLIKALEKSVGLESITLGAENTHVQPDRDGFTVTTTADGETQTVRAPKVISTVGGHAFGGLYPFLADEELAPFRELEYATVTQVILGFKDWKGMPLNAFGGLIPAKENKNMLGVLFTSSFFQNRAPEGGAVLSVFMGGIRHPEMIDFSDGQIQQVLEKELVPMMKLTELKPDLQHIYRYRHAIPQYGANSKERFEMIDRLEGKYPGLILAGNIRNGIGMADRIKQARMITEKEI